MDEVEVVLVDCGIEIVLYLGEEVFDFGVVL